MKTIDRVVIGYMEGLSSEDLELPSRYKNSKAAFKHGWLNGRDDRIGRPRDSYDVLMARYKMIEDNTK